MLIIYGANIRQMNYTTKYVVLIFVIGSIFLYPRSVVVDAFLDPDYNLTEIKSDSRLPKLHTSTMTYI